MYFDSLLASDRSAPNTVQHPQKIKLFKKEMVDSNSNACQSVEPKRVCINRSKSQQQLGDYNFQAHIKHPILLKQKTSALSKYSPLSTDRSPNKFQDKLHLNNDWQQKQLLNTEKKANNTNFDEYSLKYSKKQRWRPDTSNNHDIKINLIKKSSTPNLQQFQMAHDVQKIKDYFEEATTKQSTFQSEFGLKGSAKFLEREVSILNRERNENKRKLIEYVSSLQNLKQQNEHLKKTIGKSNEKLDSRSKDKGKENFDFLEAKKQLKDEIQTKEILESQRKGILLELNQTLMMHQSEKLKWDNNRKIMQIKIDSLLTEIKEKRNDIQSMTEKCHEANCENKKLKQKIQIFQKQILEKEKQSKWMICKVNDLKEALDHLQTHGNERIQKLESQLRVFESAKKGNLKTEAKVKQKQSIILFLRNQIELKDKQILRSKAAIECSEKLNQKLRIMESQNLESVDKIKELEQKIKDLKEQNIKILSLSDINIAKLSQEFQAVSHENQRLKIEVTDQNNILQKERKLLIKAQQELRRNQLRNHEQRQEQKRVQIQAKKIEQMIIEIQQSDQVCQRFRLEAEKHKCDATQLNKRLNITQGKCSQLESVVKQLENDLDEARAIIKEHEVDINRLKDELLKALRELSMNQESVNRATKQLKNMEGLLSDKTLYADSITQQLSACNKKLSSRNEQIENLNREVSRLQDKLPAKNSTSYSQLELRLCATLGMFLTAEVDKIVCKVQQLVDGNQTISSMGLELKMYKSKCSQVCESNRQLSCDLQRIKQENACLLSQSELLVESHKMCEDLLGEANQAVIRLRMKIANDSFNFYGNRK